MDYGFSTWPALGIRSSMIDEIVDSSIEHETVKRGGNNTCKIVTYNGKQYAVLKTSNIECYNASSPAPINKGKSPEEIMESESLSFINVMEATNRLTRNNAIPIVGFTYDRDNVAKYGEGEHACAYARGFIVQPKAPGEELFGGIGYVSSENTQKIEMLLQYTKRYSSITPSQFAQFVSNYYEISKELKIDPSKRSNFFYDEVKGFSFIDLNFLRNEHHSDERLRAEALEYVALQFRATSESVFETLTDEQKDAYIASNVKIYKRMAQGFLEAGYSKEEVASVFDSRLQSDLIISHSGLKNTTDLIEAEKVQ